MDQTWAAWGLVVLLVLAGCTGSGGQFSQPVSVTPAPVPTDTPPTPDYRIAPGLSQASVVGPFALASAHAQLLRSSVYHVRIEEHVEGPDGTIHWRVLEGSVANWTLYALDVRRGVNNETVQVSSFYANGRQLYQRQVNSNTVRYAIHRERLYKKSAFPNTTLGNPLQFNELYVAMDGSRPAYIGVTTVNGVESHGIAASAPENHDTLAVWEHVDALDEYVFEANVTDAGLIREYRVEYTATADGEQHQVVRTAQWSRVGTATVTAPDWYATARNRTAP